MGTKLCSKYKGNGRALAALFLLTSACVVGATTSCNHPVKPTPTTSYTLILDLNGCNVDGKPTYTKTYIEGTKIDDITVSPNSRCILDENSVSDDYREYWKASTETPDSYVLSNIVMDKSYEIKITTYVAYNATCSLSDEFVTLSRTRVAEDNDYEATIKVKENKINDGFVLRDEFDVYSKTTLLSKEDYTYHKHDYYFDLLIPKNLIEGDIEIDFGEELEELTDLCFEAEEVSKIYYTTSSSKLENIEIKYRKRLTESWSDWEWETDKSTIITLQKGEKLYVKNNAPTLSELDNYFTFVIDQGKITVSGNVMSLLSDRKLKDNCFRCLFKNCTGLTSTPNLPAITLADNCYYEMFYGCTGLTSAPELPATILKSSCYQGMFMECTGLTSAPELPATTLANCCYRSMFYSCTELVFTPELLPATTLAENCYHFMFYNCTKLLTAPKLPATTLVDSCYYCMFSVCSSLNVSEGNGNHEIFACPDVSNVESFVGSMFYKCKGFNGTPTKGLTYYWNDYQK